MKIKANYCDWIADPNYGYVNLNTGEIQEKRKQNPLYKDETYRHIMIFQEFYEYIEDEGCPLNSTDIIIIQVIASIAMEYNVKSTIFNWTDEFVEKVSKRSKFGKGTVRTSFTRIKEQGIILKIKAGVYVINPRFFWWASRYSRRQFLAEIWLPLLSEFQKKNYPEKEQVDQLKAEAIKYQQAAILTRLKKYEK